MVAGFVLGLESSGGVLSRWMEQRESGLPEDYWDVYLQNVQTVTAADVQRRPLYFRVGARLCRLLAPLL